MSRRVVLGKRRDGSFGLDVALPGYDAFTDDRSDVNKFSFSTDWDDLVKLSQVGKLYVPFNSGAAFSLLYEQVPIPNFGYIPYFDARFWNGANRVYDDGFYFPNGSAQRGVAAECWPHLLAFKRDPDSQNYWATYAVYRFPMDQQ